MNLSFLGNGIRRPFRRDEKNDFANASGLELVLSCAGQVLGTRAQSPSGSGELPWRTEFGSKIHLIRHRNNNVLTREIARTFAQEALAKWEPRLLVVDVTIVSSPSAPRLVELDIHVRPITQNNAANRTSVVRVPLLAG